MGKRITWKDSYYGFVNGIRLFTISRHVVRSDPGWIMQTELPGKWKNAPWMDDDKKALEAKAEEILEVFVKKMGARF